MLHLLTDRGSCWCFLLLVLFYGFPSTAVISKLEGQLNNNSLAGILLLSIVICTRVDPLNLWGCAGSTPASSIDSNGSSLVVTYFSVKSQLELDPFESIELKPVRVLLLKGIAKSVVIQWADSNVA